MFVFRCTKWYNIELKNLVFAQLLDENNFQPDGLQQLSFALCHVYARSTRSVSIPAPVYCEPQLPSFPYSLPLTLRYLDADIVCSRAKNHVRYLKFQLFSLTNQFFDSTTPMPPFTSPTTNPRCPTKQQQPLSKRSVPASSRCT